MKEVNNAKYENSNRWNFPRNSGYNENKGKGGRNNNHNEKQGKYSKSGGQRNRYNKNRNRANINFVLYKAANQSFIRSADGMACKLTSNHTVQTPNGASRINKKTILPLKKWSWTIISEAVIYKDLEANFLSTKQIIEKMGEIIFDKQGAELLPNDS